MSAGVWGFVGVLVGGVLTITGQTIAELLKSRVASTDRQDRRAQLAREFQRGTLIALQGSLDAYRAELRLYGAEPLPTMDADARLARVRVSYQLLLYRVSSEAARTAAQAWESAALRWFQQDDFGTAAEEAEAWLEAMRRLGEAIRATE